MCWWHLISPVSYSELKLVLGLFYFIACSESGDKQGGRCDKAVCWRRDDLFCLCLYGCVCLKLCVCFSTFWPEMTWNYIKTCLCRCAFMYVFFFLAENIVCPYLSLTLFLSCLCGWGKGSSVTHNALQEGFPLELVTKGHVMTSRKKITPDKGWCLLPFTVALFCIAESVRLMWCGVVTRVGHSNYMKSD